VNGYEFNSPISTATEFLHSCQDGTSTVSSAITRVSLRELATARLINRLCECCLHNANLRVTVSAIARFQRPVLTYKSGWRATHLYYALFYDARRHKNATAVLQQNWLYINVLGYYNQTNDTWGEEMSCIQRRNDWSFNFATWGTWLTETELRGLSEWTVRACVGGLSQGRYKCLYVTI
jgi:hypothetical protein